MASKPKPGSLKPIRPLLATAPSTSRGIDRHRALFGLDLHHPRLVAAWWKGDTLTAAAAADLWARHSWEPLRAPADVAEVLALGIALQAE